MYAIRSYYDAITGMTCSGCRAHVEKTLNSIEGVIDAHVDLEKAEATIVMNSHIPTETLNEALVLDSGGRYGIVMPGEHHHKHDHKMPEKPKGKGTGTFYCPMHCEGDKTYDKPGDCPVCGMDLVEEISSHSFGEQYTCPMHPEVVKDGPDSCPICGIV